MGTTGCSAPQSAMPCSSECGSEDWLAPAHRMTANRARRTEVSPCKEDQREKSSGRAELTHKQQQQRRVP